jgi:hypothetical protein
MKINVAAASKALTELYPISPNEQPRPKSKSVNQLNHSKPNQYPFLTDYKLGLPALKLKSNQ